MLKTSKKAFHPHHLEYVFRIWDKEKEYYRWIQNNAVAKPQEDGTSIVYAIFTDITKQEKLEQSYLERLRVLQKSNADALCMADVNLTKNRFRNLQAEGIIKKYCESADTLDEIMMLSSNTVIDPEEQQQYRTIFQCEAMLKRFEQGETHIQFKHFYRINEKHTMMVETIFDLIREPLTGDVIGIAYARDLNKEKVSEILLDVALQTDYPMTALIYMDTGEYYYYEVDCGNYCVHKQDFWNEVYERIANSVSDQQLEKLRNEFTYKKVVAYLEEHDEFIYAFNGTYRGKSGRYEVKFQYVDKKHRLLLGLFRDITDESLYQQYKYDSEHDELTGLYNRNKVFAEARKLLNEHPDEQFIMLHCSKIRKNKSLWLDFTL